MFTIHVFFVTCVGVFEHVVLNQPAPWSQATATLFARNVNRNAVYLHHHNIAG